MEFSEIISGNKHMAMMRCESVRIFIDEWALYIMHKISLLTIILEKKWKNSGKRFTDIDWCSSILCWDNDKSIPFCCLQWYSAASNLHTFILLAYNCTVLLKNPIVHSLDLDIFISWSESAYVNQPCLHLCFWWPAKKKKNASNMAALLTM